MSSQAVIQRGPGVTLKAQVLSAQIPSIKTWQIAERREALAALLFEGRQRVWVTEEAARCGKRRSLIEDNPASG